MDDLKLKISPKDELRFAFRLSDSSSVPSPVQSQGSVAGIMTREHAMSASKIAGAMEWAKQTITEVE